MSWKKTKPAVGVLVILVFASAVAACVDEQKGENNQDVPSSKLTAVAMERTPVLGRLFEECALTTGQCQFAIEVASALNDGEATRLADTFAPSSVACPSTKEFATEACSGVPGQVVDAIVFSAIAKPTLYLSEERAISRLKTIISEGTPHGVRVVAIGCPVEASNSCDGDFAVAYGIDRSEGVGTLLTLSVITLGSTRVVDSIAVSVSTSAAAELNGGEVNIAQRGENVPYRFVRWEVGP